MFRPEDGAQLQQGRRKSLAPLARFLRQKCEPHDEKDDPPRPPPLRAVLRLVRRNVRDGGVYAGPPRLHDCLE